MKSVLENAGGVSAIRSGFGKKSMRKARALSAAILPMGAVLGAMAFSPLAAHGVTQIANNTAGPLNTGTSYVSGTAPGAADMALFNSAIGSAQTQTLGGSFTLGEIQVVNPGGLITIANDSSGSILTLNGVVNASGVNVGIDMSAATQNLTFGSANTSLTIGAAQSWLVNTGRTLTMNGVVAGSANISITGGGTVSLATTADTFTGNYVVNSGATLSENVAQSATSGVVLNGGTLSGTIALNGTNFIYANSGTSAVSLEAGLDLYALFAGNGNIAWNEPSLNGVTQGNTVATSPFGNFGGTVSWGASAAAIRMQAQSSNQGQYTLNPFANFDLGSAGGSLTAKLGSTAWVLGGLQGTGSTDAVGGTAGGHGSNIIVGGANLTQTYAGTFLNTSGGGDEFTKVGIGTMTLTGIDSAASTYTGYANDGFSNAVLGGNLILNHSVNPTGLLATAGYLEIGQGGTLTVLGNSGASTATTETVALLTVNNGGGNLVLTPNGGLSTTTSVGAITATAAGAVLNITENTGTATLKTTSALTDSILGGGHVTFTNASGVTGFATTTGTTPFTVAQYTAATVYSTGAGSSTTNYTINDNATVTSGASFYTMQVTNDTAGQSVNFGGAFVDTTGAILFTGPNAETMSGGTINTSLIIQNYGATLTYNNAVTGTATMTFAGPGTTVLGGGTANTYTGQTYIDSGATLSVASNATLGAPATGATINLFGGTLQATGGTSFGLFNGTAGTNNRSIVIGGGGGTFDITSGTTLTVAGLVSNTTEDGAISSYGPLTKTDSGTLILSDGSNSYSGATIIKGGILSVSTLANGNTVSSIGQAPSTADALVINGGTLQYTGGTISTDRTFTAGVNGATLDASGTGNLTFSNTAPIVANTTAAGSGARTLTFQGSWSNSGSTSTNTFAGQIVDGTGGSTSVIKTGAGSWALTNPSHTYTGSTVINQGTLYLEAPGSTNPISTSPVISVGLNSTLDTTGLAGGGITLSGSQTLSGSGTVNGAVTVPAGSTIAPGTFTTGSAGAGTLTTGTLTAAANSLFSFGISAANTDPFTTGASIVAPSNLVLPASGTVMVNLYQPNSSAPFASAGTYDLFSLPSLSNVSGGTIATAFSINAATDNAAFSYVFGTSGNDITVTLTQSSVAATWALNGNGVWDTGVPGNWIGGVPNLAGSTATFGTDGGTITVSPLVTLDQNQSVGGMSFTAPQSYTIQSSGGVLTLDNKGNGAAIAVSAGTANLITAPVLLNDNLTVNIGSGDSLSISGNIGNSAGPQTITLAGSGTLALSGSNTYGPSAGTVGTTVSGTGILQVGSNTALGAGDLAITGGGTLQSGAAGLILANNISVAAATNALIDTQANTFTLTGAIGDGGSGTGGLTKIGSGTLILDNNETYGGTTNISNGALQLGNADSQGSVSGNIIDSGTLVLNRVDNPTFANTISGTGNLNQIGAGNVTLSGTNTFGGITNISSGSIILGNSLALQNSTLNYNGQGGNLSFGTLTAATLGGLSGSQSLALLNTTPAAVALTVGNNSQSTTFSGVLSGGGSLIKTGNGTLTLGGSNTFTGNTAINTGTLTVTGAIGAGATQGSVTLSPGTTLNVNGGIVTASSLTQDTNGGTSTVNVNSGSVNVSTGQIAVNGDNGSGGVAFNVYGGTVTANSVLVDRGASAGTGLQTTDPNVGGLTINGATAVMNITTTLNMDTSGSDESDANVTVVQGTLNVGGLTTITMANARTSVLDVAGGTFNGTGGVQIGAMNEAGDFEFLIHGGTANVPGIIFGATAQASGTNALLMEGGTLYVGAGGMVNNGSTGATVLINLGSTAYTTAPILAAAANWSSGLAMTLTNTTAGLLPTIQAANASGGAENITLGGVLSGTGGFTKTGAGTLFLNSSGNTYSGVTNINGGTLNINSEYALGGANYAGLTFNGGTLQYSNPLLNAVTDITNIGTAKPVTINAGGATIDTNGNNINFASSIGNNGSGSLTLIGGGTLNVSGGTYTGATTILAGSTLYANTAGALAPLSAFNVNTGTLDVTAGANTVGSLNVAATGTLNLSYGSILTVTGAATFSSGAMNLFGTSGTLPETLINYNSETGTFAAASVTGIPMGDKLAYTLTALELVSNGPANLTWNNSGGSPMGDGLTWNTTSLNFNNGTSPVAYSDNSNTSSGDNVTFNDANNGNYNVSISGVVSPTSVTFSNTGTYNMSGANSSSGIAGPGSLTLTGTGTVILSSNDTYTGGTNVSSGKLVLASSTALPANSSLIIASGAKVTINRSTGTPYIPQASALVNNGTINITNNAMIVHNGSIGTISAQIAQAYASGTWTGTNSAGGVITSSLAASDTSHLTAVGVATGLTSFEGMTVNTSDVLVKYTYYGDANLDGHVDGTDYSRIDNGYLMGLTGWYNGDFNYDGVIDGSDYTLIDNAYNTQGAQIAGEVASPTAQIVGAIGSSAVPEPATLGLLGIGAVGLLGRRRRGGVR